MIVSLSLKTKQLFFRGVIIQFFKPEALEFLNQIKKNNNKEWFSKNRHRYEELILEPSKRFVREFGEELLALDPHINAIDKVNGSLFRIYRDVRLSKDKTPLKSRIGIIFWRGSNKRLQSASFYLHFSPEEFLVASGIRGFSKDMLHGYREYIKDEKNARSLNNIMQDLLSKGFLFPDPKYKRYPRGFSSSDKYSNLSLYANMYAYKRLNPKEICSKRLNQILFEIYSDLLPMYEWIYELSMNVVIDGNQKSLSLS